MDPRTLRTWATIVMIVIASTAGEVLIAFTMQRVGDLHQLRRAAGLAAVVRTVAAQVTLWLGIVFMAMGYFSLLIALSWADVSLVVPASASLTFVTNALAARIFLHERVDRR